MDKIINQISEKKKGKLSALVTTIAGVFLFILSLMISQIPDVIASNSASEEVDSACSACSGIPCVTHVPCRSLH